VAIDFDEVSVAVVEYRPIYVTGGVARPGEYPYRPFMTVQQAVALSGGYEFIRGARTDAPEMAVANLRSEYESLWLEFAREQQHEWRLKTEIGGNDNANQQVPLDTPVPESILTVMAKMESARLKANLSEYQRQKEFLQHAIQQADALIEILSEQQQKEEQGVKDDINDFDKITDLYKKNVVTTPRLSESRRSALSSFTRKLQTSAQLLQARNRHDELTRQLEKLDGERTIDLLRELQQTTVHLAELRAKLEAVEVKLQFTNAPGQPFGRVTANKPEFTIVRKGANGRARTIAGEEFELQPGDVVEIMLNHGSMNGLAAR
jgi:polysaccharide export outer membrane protein